MTLLSKDVQRERRRLRTVQGRNIREEKLYRREQHITSLLSNMIYVVFKETGK